MLPPYLLFTVLAVQFIYILVNWYFFRQKEYVFYAIYIVALTAYFSNKYLGDANGMISLGSIKYYKLYLDKNLVIVAFYCYFKFVVSFIEAEKRYPEIYRFMRYTYRFALFYLTGNITLVYLTRNLFLENVLFFATNSVFTTIVIVYLSRMVFKKIEPLFRFVFVGTCLYGFGSFITLLLSMNKSLLENDHFLYFQIGVFLEMICLNAGLIYKSNMFQRQLILSQEKIIEEYEKSQALSLEMEHTREQISRDLHDDVGATLSSVKAYSEILKDNPGNTVIAELIKDNAAEMIERLEVIAWATNPQHDNFKSLQSRMQKFAMPICHSQNIQCSFCSDDINDEITIPGEARQNIFLVFKEVINNMVKYASATKCSVKLLIDNHKFIMQIADNGRGLDGSIQGNGNGLANMRSRTAELTGALDIDSASGKGTEITMSLPFPFTIQDSGESNQHDK
jgi:signal transduction histidine kinase